MEPFVIALGVVLALVIGYLAARHQLTASPSADLAALKADIQALFTHVSTSGALTAKSVIAEIPDPQPVPVPISAGNIPPTPTLTQPGSIPAGQAVAGADVAHMLGDPTMYAFLLASTQAWWNSVAPAERQQYLLQSSGPLLAHFSSFTTPA